MVPQRAETAQFFLLSLRRRGYGAKLPMQSYGGKWVMTV